MCSLVRDLRVIHSLGERRDGTSNLAPIAAVFPWYSAAARAGDFGCGVSAAFRVLSQDVFEAAGVKDTQAPFFQRDGVAGGDAIFRPIRQRTEPAL